MLDDSVGAWAYATAGVIWTYLGLFALTFGVVGCWRDHALASKRARRTEEFARHIALNDA
jgi:hypothetical protein